jgi:hypothetical protein
MFIQYEVTLYDLDRADAIVKVLETDSLDIAMREVNELLMFHNIKIRLTGTDGMNVVWERG